MRDACIEGNSAGEGKPHPDKYTGRDTDELSSRREASVPCVSAVSRAHFVVLSAPSNCLSVQSVNCR